MPDKTYNHEYLTSDTSLASLLVSEGYTLLIIKYNDQQQGTYVFDAKDPKLYQLVRTYHRSEATANVTLYEQARHKLLARIKEGLP